MKNAIERLSAEGQVILDDKGFVLRVRPVMWPRAWLDCVSRGGEHYVGGCCGAMSAAQDLMCNMVRGAEEGIPTAMFIPWGDIMRQHDGFNIADIPTPKMTSDNPLERMLFLYEAIKGHVAVALPKFVAEPDPHSI